ncbi:MAG: YIP1 family protein [Candidatus Bathyarchaeota archaeon]
MSESDKGFVELLLGVLRRPGEYFGYVEEDDLAKGLIIVAVMVVLAAASTSVYMSKIPLEVLVPQLGELGVDIGDVAGSMGLFSAVGAGVSILLGWVLSTVVMHGLANLAGGRGSMKRLFAMHGFAAAPHAANYALRTVDAFVSSSQSLVTYFMAGRVVEAKLVRAVLGTNMLTVFGVAGLVYLTYALSINYQLRRDRALAVAIVPLLLYIALSYLSPA